MKKELSIIFLVTILCLAFIATVNATNTTLHPSSAQTQVLLTSITIDPEDSTGQTTNAPGAWSTNLADPLSQVGVKSNGNFLNQQSGEITLGEISIPLQIGLNSFELVGTGVFPTNLYYGAVLFFNGVQTPPQIAVYNQNGVTSNFMVQPKDTIIMGGANGGLFFDVAPGHSFFFTDDGLKVEVISFTITAQTSSSTDEVSHYYISADGINDMTATLVLKVTPKDNVALENLIDEIPSMNIPSQVQNTLIERLGHVLASLNAPNAELRNNASNELNAILHYIAAQTNKKIALDQSNKLVSSIQSIIASIET